MSPFRSVPTAFAALALRSCKQVSAMLDVAGQVSNPSPFSGHRETGNPSADRSSDVHRSDDLRVVQRSGQGGETPAIFLEARRRVADAVARTVPRVTP